MCKTRRNAEIAMLSNAQAAVRKNLGYEQAVCMKFFREEMHRKVLHNAQGLWKREAFIRRSSGGAVGAADGGGTNILSRTAPVGHADCGATPHYLVGHAGPGVPQTHRTHTPRRRLSRLRVWN